MWWAFVYWRVLCFVRQRNATVFKDYGSGPLIDNSALPVILLQQIVIINSTKKRIDL